MKPYLFGFFGLCLGVAIAALMISLSGCASSPTHAENASTALGYNRELARCIASAPTKADSVACRCRVNTKWQRPCTAPADDGGM